MQTYIVTATRSDSWWAIHADVPGAVVWTQARRLDQVEDMAREAIALTLDVPEDSFTVDVQPQVDDDLRDALREVHDLSQAAESAQAAASESRRMIVREMKNRGFTVRDTGRLIGVSSQRVSQLLAD